MIKEAAFFWKSEKKGLSPPLSCAAGAELEMLRELPGAGPAPCSTQQPAGVWPSQEHASSSATFYHASSNVNQHKPSCFKHACL